MHTKLGTYEASKIVDDLRMRLIAEGYYEITPELSVMMNNLTIALMDLKRREHDR